MAPVKRPGGPPSSGPRSYDNSRRAARVWAVRRRVVDAAGHLFLEHGYPTTTMEAIGAASDTPMATLYRLFAAKADILRAVLETAYVGDDEIHVLLFECADRLIAAHDEFHVPVVPVLVQAGAQAVQQVAFVVHEKNVFHACGLVPRPSMGSCSVNSVPLPALLLTPIWPPCLSTTIEWVIARP